MPVHIHQLLYVQYRNGGRDKEERKLYCSSQDVDEPNLGFLIVNALFSLGAQFWSRVACSL